MSRRGNGLSADAYTPLIDLAPELADAMLTALREAGIAAYATMEGEPRALDETRSLDEPRAFDEARSLDEPRTATEPLPTAEPRSAADPRTADRPGTEPPEPESAASVPGEPGRLERLYVDDAMESAAEDILHTHLSRLREQRRAAGAAGAGAADGSTTEAESTGPSPAADTDQGGHPVPSGSGSGGQDSPGSAGAATAERDDDAIWAEIIAGFDEEPTDGETPWPEQENVRPEDPGIQDHTNRLPSSRVIKPAGAEILAPEEFDDSDEDTDDEGHYVPPPPPPLPTGDPVTRGAWLALVGGPLYLLLTVILGWEVPGWAAFVAVAAFIGGFVALVLRMGDEPRDGDDGAVI